MPSLFRRAPRGLEELIGRTVQVAFRDEALYSCRVMDVDRQLGFIKICFPDDPDTIIWKNLAEIVSLNIEMDDLVSAR